MSNYIKKKKKSENTCSSSKQAWSIEDQQQYRIITKNLIYIIGLSENWADKDLLIKHEYLGQYGKILKIVINKGKAYHSYNIYGPSYSAYVTYSKPSEAAVAILSLDNTVVDHHLIRASFGTTKYCWSFLKKETCLNKACLYLHRQAQDCDIIKKTDLNTNTNLFYNQQWYAIKIADIYSDETRKLWTISKDEGMKAMLPTPDLIFLSQIVIDNDPRNKLKESPVIPRKNNSWNQSGEPKAQVNKQSKTININSINSRDSTPTKRSNQSISSNKSTNNKSLSNILKDKNDLHINTIKLQDIETFTTSSTTMNSKDENYNEGTSWTRKAFIMKEKSRFDFVQSYDPPINIIKIPNFIRNIINKGSKMLLWTKHYNNNDYINDSFVFNDYIYSEQTNDNSEWVKLISAPYIREYTELNNQDTNWEDNLWKDFEQITSFIINKATYKKPLFN